MDKRNHQRHSPCISIRLRDKDGDLDVDLDIKDLSIGGIFIRSKLLWEEGEELTIYIQLNHGEKLTLKGRVVRIEDTYFVKNRHNIDHNDFGMGIEFIDITDQDRQKISRLLKEDQ